MDLSSVEIIFDEKGDIMDSLFECLFFKKKREEQ